VPECTIQFNFKRNFQIFRAFESSVEALERNVDQKFPLTKAESNWFGERVPNVPLAHDNLERHCKEISNVFSDIQDYFKVLLLPKLFKVSQILAFEFINQMILIFLRISLIAKSLLIAQIT